jgi:hypothetical protein
MTSNRSARAAGRLRAAAAAAAAVVARTGHAYVASVLAENPSAPLAQNPAILTLTTAVKGALQLAAGRA